jgi:hypothetical protein
MTSKASEPSRLTAPSPDGRQRPRFSAVLSDRIAIIVRGYFAACLAVALILSTVIAFKLSSGPGQFILSLILFGMLVSFFVAIFALLPSVLLIGLAERTGVRSVVCYGGGGALIGVAACGLYALVTRTLPPLQNLGNIIVVFLGPALVGGVIYWLIAGRTAGPNSVKTPNTTLSDASNVPLTQGHSD